MRNQRSNILNTVYRIFFSFLIIFFAGLFSHTSNSYGIGSCSPNYAYFGTEWVASNCSPEGGADYIATDLYCSGGTVIKYSYQLSDDYTNRTPSTMESALLYPGSEGYNYRYFRNGEGTRFLRIANQWASSLVLEGVSINQYSANTWYYDVFDITYFPPENGTVYDNDGDGHTTCSDCNDSNAQINPSINNDGDSFDSCIDCNDGDPNISSGDECYASVPDDTELGVPNEEACPEDNPQFAGNPINILNGNNYESSLDLAFPSPNQKGFFFERYYNSQSSESGALGYGWSHNYDIKLTANSIHDNITHIKIKGPTGRGRYFARGTGKRWDGVFKEKSYVIAETDGTYSWYKTDGSVYIFLSDGKLNSIEDAHGNSQTLSYVNDHLDTINDSASGRTLTFHYYTNNPDLLEYITGPVTTAVGDGIWVSYGYDSNNNLTTVTYADGSGLNYEYNDADIHNLTGKKDKESHIITNWGYDSEDRATSSNSRILDKTVTINYVDASTVDVTDAYGSTRTHTLSLYNSLYKRVSSVTGLGGCIACIGGSPIRYEYDTDLNVIEEEYANGTINKYEDYDDRGNSQTVTYAFGITEEQSFTYTYHPTFNLPLTKSESSVLSIGNNKVTTWDYDNDGNGTPNESPTKLLRRKIEQGYTWDAAGGVVAYEYITTYDYNSKGQLTSINGILAGDADTTSFNYDSASGDLLSITQPYIGTTTFPNNEYDAAGNPGQMTDVNSQNIIFTYDGRNRLLTSTINGLQNSRSFHTSGLLATVTDPGGRALTYYYDSTYGRLESITDGKNEYLSFNYDSQGNRTEESAYDSLDNRKYWQRFDYNHPDFPGKLWKVVNPDDTARIFSYNSMGNISSVQDEVSLTTTYQYDPLSRLKQIIQPDSLTTHIVYDSQDNQTSLTDPEAKETTFVMDDYGRVLSETSPDSGIIKYFYDIASNSVEQTDAINIKSIQYYDNLNRLTSVSYPDDTSQNVIFSYDSGTNGIGRLSGISDQAGTATINYNTVGQITGEPRTNTGMTAITVGYGYNVTSGDLDSMTYPSGMVVSYLYDSSGQVSAILADGQNVISNITYMPFGPVEDYVVGSTGLSLDQTFDQKYLLSRILAGGMDYQYLYNPDGTVKQITGNSLPGTTIENTEYFYLTGSNTLDYSTGTEAKNYSAENNGNIISDGTRIFVYNLDNRLIEVKEGETTIAQYEYDGLGRRVKKTVGATITYYYYDLSSKLVAETDGSGNLQKEYIYLGNTPVAMKIYGIQAGMYYFLNDHLGTPQQIIDSSGAVVWQALYSPFGSAQLLTETVSCNLRFPGQYYDSETGLHYNWQRYYDPSTGRYLTPDPIGLAGGINLYSYVDQNPANYIDPDGLHGILLGGRGPFMFRPSFLRGPNPRYTPPTRPTPQAPKPPPIERIVEPVEPLQLPKTWWGELLDKIGDLLDGGLEGAAVCKDKPQSNTWPPRQDDLYDPTANPSGVI